MRFIHNREKGRDYARAFLPLLVGMAIVLGSCGREKASSAASADVQEDMRAKQMLQGVWLNADDDEPVFRIVGDTIFFPDSTSLPTLFQVFGDTLVMHGASDVRYAIVRQAPHLFEFRNQAGDVVKLVKSDDTDDATLFEKSAPVAINQNLLIKRDTIFMSQGKRYHCYVQVNPTTYKVIKMTYNDEGVSVGNVYYDNIINLAVFQGAQKVFSSDFHKNDFAKHVPAEVLKQSILSDMLFSHVDEEGIHYSALICEPDSPSSYAVDVLISYNGKITFKNNKE